MFRNCLVKFGGFLLCLKIVLQHFILFFGLTFDLTHHVYNGQGYSQRGNDVCLYLAKYKH
tara:strand:- start:2289 stop:2468 length:180 start_codon:yes stop_codon:yes gene_type:complete